jgi:diketogulonate reductase-like aldo/keto reductase
MVILHFASYFQVECHPYLTQNKLIAFCKERDIVITAYSPLCSPNSIAADLPAPLEDPKIQELAKKYNKSAAQIILRYLVSIYTGLWVL